MTGINNTIIAKELNDTCKNKYETFFQEWDTDDIDLKNRNNRNYCLAGTSGSNIICEKCSNTLKLYTELYKLIVKTDDDDSTFNKVIKLYYVHQRLK
jgi:hypothetical protein